ncbi:hypothetical protein [Crenobacter luteus]|uniref:hypothetical protein n=1 Tax=Crenobacter luteus TaxID=1452487 RepID=UPI0012E93598|nr:hypothetical protein [Crenobacter luteus]
MTFNAFRRLCALGLLGLCLAAPAQATLEDAPLPGDFQPRAPARAKANRAAAPAPQPAATPVRKVQAEPRPARTTTSGPKRADRATKRDHKASPRPVAGKKRPSSVSPSLKPRARGVSRPVAIKAKDGKRGRIATQATSRRHEGKQPTSKAAGSARPLQASKRTARPTHAIGNRGTATQKATARKLRAAGPASMQKKSATPARVAAKPKRVVRSPKVRPQQKQRPARSAATAKSRVQTLHRVSKSGR